MRADAERYEDEEEVLVGLAAAFDADLARLAPLVIATITQVACLNKSVEMSHKRFGLLERATYKEQGNVRSVGKSKVKT